VTLYVVIARTEPFADSLNPLEAEHSVFLGVQLPILVTEASGLFFEDFLELFLPHGRFWARCATPRIAMLDGDMT